jgi:hypothetical protein
MLTRKHYENSKNWKAIEIGGVLGSDIISTLIKIGTASDLSHIFLNFIGEKYNIFEARAFRGVINHNDPLRYCRKNAKIKFIKIYIPIKVYNSCLTTLKKISKVEPKKVNIINGFLTRKTKYDFKAIFGYVIQKYKDDPDREICSEVFRKIYCTWFKVIATKLGRFSPEDAYNRAETIKDIQDNYILDKPAEL